jgi:hypothetical protein
MLLGANSITKGWEWTGMYPFNRHCKGWESAINGIGQITMMSSLHPANVNALARHYCVITRTEAQVEAEAVSATELREAQNSAVFSDFNLCSADQAEYQSLQKSMLALMARNKIPVHRYSETLGQDAEAIAHSQVMFLANMLCCCYPNCESNLFLSMCST